MRAESQFATRSLMTILTPVRHLEARLAALPGNARGAMWMLASALCFTAMTTLVKFLGDGYSPAVQTVYRQLAGVALLAPMMIRQFPHVFHTSRMGILLFRAGAGTFAMILSFYSFQVLPLANANALSFTRTLWLVPLAAFVLGEALGTKRIVTALVGFSGVVLMVGTLGLDGQVSLAGQAAALTAALLFALTITGMKVMVRDHSTLTILVYSTLLGLVFALPVAVFQWVWPTWLDLGLLSAMGVIGVLTQTCYVRGMAVGDAAAMAPIDYTRLVFAVIVGFAVFSEIPAWTTLVGAAVVIGATLFLTWSESREARKLAEAKSPPAE